MLFRECTEPWSAAARFRVVLRTSLQSSEHRFLATLYSYAWLYYSASVVELRAAGSTLISLLCSICWQWISWCCSKSFWGAVWWPCKALHYDTWCLCTISWTEHWWEHIWKACSGVITYKMEVDCTGQSSHTANTLPKGVEISWLAKFWHMSSLLRVLTCNGDVAVWSTILIWFHKPIVVWTEP